MAYKKETLKTSQQPLANARKGRKPVDPDETREQKLARLGNARVTKAIKSIGLVGNLATYKPTDAQIDKIITALAESCQRLDSRLRGTRRESYTFTIT